MTLQVAVNKIDEDGKIENVAFIGKINSVGNNSTVGGIAGSNTWDSSNRTYVMRPLQLKCQRKYVMPFVLHAQQLKSGTKAR